MVRQRFQAVNAKRKQIAIHGQKYAVESTYWHLLQHAVGRNKSEIVTR
jgi:hypothetical protein